MGNFVVGVFLTRDDKTELLYVYQKPEDAESLVEHLQKAYAHIPTWIFTAQDIEVRASLSLKEAYEDGLLTQEYWEGAFGGEAG